ncbi:hypothetical protein CHU32_26150 [Superficieibacter electus]|uniref:Toxin SymE-like domain-containing protein n=1 Tax=Superficieibacter electus TaxID=2022662 RepID=A0A2P5GHF3_9ENTR|nr:hypothetical protein CHU33_26235 [Superficieibacter electus]POP41827.1 hypothetical protein CHU32_26150 [Superficieibacter electus]
MQQPHGSHNPTGLCTYDCVFSPPPSQHLKGNGLGEAGFVTGHGVTVMIPQGCIVLMADNNEV